MRKVAAHRIKTPTFTHNQSICDIVGSKVMAIRPLLSEESMVEWLDGTISCQYFQDNPNSLQAYYNDKLLKE